LITDLAKPKGLLGEVAVALIDPLRAWVVPTAASGPVMAAKAVFMLGVGRLPKLEVRGGGARLPWLSFLGFNEVSELSWKFFILRERLSLLSLLLWTILANRSSP
jgi:hypothetical protein